MDKMADLEDEIFYDAETGPLPDDSKEAPVLEQTNPRSTSFPRSDLVLVFGPHNDFFFTSKKQYR